MSPTVLSISQGKNGGSSDVDRALLCYASFMRISIPAVIVLALIFSSTTAAAQTGDVLDSSVDMWDAASATLRLEVEQEMQDIHDAAVSELFPDSSLTEEEGNILGDKRDERTSQYVSAMIDGKTVIFRDVPRTSWFAPYVRDIAEKGIVSGYRDAEGRPTGEFGPQDNVTLEQVAKVLVYAGGHNPAECGKSTLNRTSSGSWSVPFVGCAEILKWSVFEDGSVDAHRPATRAEVVITMMQSFNVKIGESSGSESGFTDVTASTLFGDAIQQAKHDGIVAGYTDEHGQPNGLFGPNDPVTRAEFAKIITNGIQRYSAR